LRRPAGYSRRPLAAKLGFKQGFRISFVHEPNHYVDILGGLPPGTTVLGARATNLDLVHLFATRQHELDREFPNAKRRMKPDGTLWVSWPKQSSSLVTDLNENIVREIGLANGLVDVKVAAVDEDWSALKFVYRLKDRAQLR
jgi:hypothetical protein